MNATTSSPANAPNPAITVADVQLAATQEIEAMKREGIEKEFTVGVELKMKGFLEMMAAFDSKLKRMLEHRDPAQGDKTPEMSQLAVETYKTMSAYIDGLRFRQQGAAIGVELYKMPDEAKSTDAVLDFMKQQELRSLLRQKTAAEVEAFYRKALEAGNSFMVRAIEGDPLQSLISQAIVEDGRRRRAEKAFPAQSKKMNDILRAQRTFDTVLSKAMQVMGIRPVSAAGKIAA